MSIWNEDTVKQLGDLIAADKSFREIALILGVSRNAIAGASNRHFGGGGAVPSALWTDEDRATLRELVRQKLTIREICDKTGKSSKGVYKQLAKLGLKAARPELSTGYKPPNLPGKERLEPETPTAFLGLSLFDLKQGQCRYPHGEGPFLFCGQPAQEECSYCAFHNDLTHKGLAYATRNRFQPENQTDPRRPDNNQDTGGRDFRLGEGGPADNRQACDNHPSGDRGREVEGETDDERGALTFRPIGDIAAEIVERLA